MKRTLLIAMLYGCVYANAQTNILYPQPPAANAPGANLTAFSSWNTFMGYLAGNAALTVQENSYYGFLAGTSNIHGSANTYIGNIAGYLDTSGNENTYIGDQAGYSMIYGNDNTYLGYYAGGDLSTGSNNLFLGAYAGENTSNGTENIGIGAHSWINGSLTNAVAIGSHAYVSTDNTIALGGANGSGYEVNVLIGYTSSTSSNRLQINGSAVCTGTWNPSDQRLKQNIENMDNALGLINKLRPVSYEYKDNIYVDTSKTIKRDFPKGRQLGFIAQELEKVLPEFVMTDNNGFKAVNYAQMVSVLTRGIQEQDAEIKNLKAINETLTNQVNDIYQKLAQMDMNIGQCCASNAAQNTSVGNINNNKAALYQNTPNPFNEKTSIKYFLPENTQAAAIIIISAQGITMQKIALTQTGNGEITIPAGTLSSGTYYYQLLIGDQLIDSKKMVVIK